MRYQKCSLFLYLNLLICCGLMLHLDTVRWVYPLVSSKLHSFKRIQILGSEGIIATKCLLSLRYIQRMKPHTRKVLFSHGQMRIFIYAKRIEQTISEMIFSYASSSDFLIWSLSRICLLCIGPSSLAMFFVGLFFHIGSTSSAYI